MSPTRTRPVPASTNFGPGRSPDHAFRGSVTRPGYPASVGYAYPGSLSPSSISTFKECPLSYRFAYLERLPQPPSAPASKGTLVHAALEHLMLLPAPERTLGAALAALGAARIALATDPDFTGLTLTDDEWDTFHSEAEALVRRYFEIEDPRSVRPIGLELRLSTDLGGTRLRGVIDRLELDDDGELVITDYKTGAVPWEGHEQQRLSGVRLYALLCDRVLGRRPARVQLMYLSKPELIIESPSEQSVTGVARRTEAVGQAIQRACAREDFRPRPGRLCDWCAFRPYCPAWGGDPARARELLGVAPGDEADPTAGVQPAAIEPLSLLGTDA